MESMETISASILLARASPTAVFPMAVGPEMNQASEKCDMGLTLTWETNLATLRHLFYSSATDRKLCEEGYHVVEVWYFWIGCGRLAGIWLQQVHRPWNHAGHASHCVKYGRGRVGHAAATRC